MWCVKAVTACILVGFVFSLLGFVLCIPVVFLIAKSGFLFLGLLISLLGLIGINIVILELLYNFIVNRKLSKTRVFIVSILSIVILGLGIGTSVMSFNSFEYLDEQDVDTIKDVYKVDMNNELYLGFHSVSYVEKDIKNKVKKLKLEDKISGLEKIIEAWKKLWKKADITACGGAFWI